MSKNENLLETLFEEPPIEVYTPPQNIPEQQIPDKSSICVPSYNCVLRNPHFGIKNHLQSMIKAMMIQKIDDPSIDQSIEKTRKSRKYKQNDVMKILTSMRKKQPI